MRSVKNWVLNVLWILFFLLLGGCSTLKMYAGRYADGYCEKPLSQRLLVRENVAHFISPHRIEVRCYDDPKPSSGVLSGDGELTFDVESGVPDAVQ